MPAQRILYVEDDDDIRDTMTMLLEHEGYQVTARTTAEDALEELGRSRFQLLLTDYQLTGENAPWLIRTATERGFLGATPVIILSGAHDPAGVDGLRLIQKPVSQEVLFAAFAEVMPRREPVHPRAATGVRADAELRLTLYISAASPASRKAELNLGLVLRGVDRSRVEILVHDIASADLAWAQAAEEDRVVVIPTLVRRGPLPKVWVAGDLSNVDQVRDAVVPPSLLPD